VPKASGNAPQMAHMVVIMMAGSAAGSLKNRFGA